MGQGVDSEASARFSSAAPVFLSPQGGGGTRVLGRIALLLPLLSLVWLLAAAASRAALWPQVGWSLFGALGVVALALPVTLGLVYLQMSAPLRSAARQPLDRGLSGLALVPAPLWALPPLLLWGRASATAALFVLFLAVLSQSVNGARRAMAQQGAHLQTLGLVLGAAKGQSFRRLIVPVVLPAAWGGALRGAGLALGLCAPLLFLGISLPFLPLQAVEGPPAQRASAVLALVLLSLSLRAISALWQDGPEEEGR